MTNNGTQRLKDTTRELGCRATEREDILITYAAKLDKRARNAFIINAAVIAARSVLQANGISEDSLFPKSAESGVRRKRVAA